MAKSSRLMRLSPLASSRSWSRPRRNLPVRFPAARDVLSPADVVGPVCETGDTFATDRDLPPLAEDDLVALTDAGAYGAVMSSTYNSRLLVPEVMASEGRFAVIRERPSY